MLRIEAAVRTVEETDQRRAFARFRRAGTW
jgi:hypothetical protein